MSSHIIKFSGRPVQVVTTQRHRGPAGRVHEHITLETPKPVTDTARLRVLVTLERSKS